MEVGEKLSELNMTVDEIDRLAKAFKDEKFKKMLCEYAREISDPENKKKYEEEIKILEQERGNCIEFIHPTPFRALKTSVNGKQKCFINICGNDRVGKPEYKSGVSEDGRRGQCWSLPHSLHPGRTDSDSKGNKIMIYDVVFHQDTLHVASKNKTFMKMLDSTAVQQIEKVFKVTLDKNNLREMNIQYKGTPQPCVIRKPNPDYKAKKPPEKPDPLAFPYPDEKRPTTSSQTKPKESPPTISTSDAKLGSVQIQPQISKEPTKPSYTVKYRSVVDLQDFRCSRDSVQSPRPKEVVVTINLPLLKSVTHASLEVKEKSLLLETKKPAYRLVLPLAYPVDEDKGEAKFNKQRGQMTVTLPVIPSNEAFPFALGSAETVCDVQSISDGKRQGEKCEVEEEDILKEMERREGNKNEEQKSDVREDKEKQEIKVKEGDLKQLSKENNEEERDHKKGEEQMSNTQDTVDVKKNVVGVDEDSRQQNRKGQESVEEEGGADEPKSDINESGLEEEEKHKEQEQENGGESEQLNQKKKQDKQDDNKMFIKHNSRGGECDRAAERNYFGVTGFQCDTDSDKQKGLSMKETKSVTSNNILGVSPKTESDCIQEDGDVNLESCLGLIPKIKTPNIEEKNEKTEETVDATLKVKADAVLVDLISSDESQTCAVVSSKSTASSHNVVRGSCISQCIKEFSEVPALDEANKSNTVDLGNRATLVSEEMVMGSAKQEDTGEDGLPTKNVTKPPPVILREIDEDGNEKIISDHSTTAGITFQNTMMYELD
ncbi:Protein kintoun [Channa argus]|uniref:Protein kintoun n=1 Tax=Channa argus TaxID=215402 RepID=A0A6G1QFL0_CHAAH|nr:Protein kintoun [Channa argus]KAK2891819.1 hypothetical protein Q8A73_017484 [Channa argus]